MQVSLGSTCLIGILDSFFNSFRLSSYLVMSFLISYWMESAVYLPHNCLLPRLSIRLLISMLSLCCSSPVQRRQRRVHQQPAPPPLPPGARRQHPHFEGRRRRATRRELLQGRRVQRPPRESSREGTTSITIPNICSTLTQSISVNHEPAMPSLSKHSRYRNPYRDSSFFL